MAIMSGMSSLAGGGSVIDSLGKMYGGGQGQSYPRTDGMQEIMGPPQGLMQGMQQTPQNMQMGMSPPAELGVIDKINKLYDRRGFGGFRQGR